MPDKNNVKFEGIVDYIVIPSFTLLIILYCTLIFLARNTIGIIGTVILLGLGVLALFIWTKQLWVKAGAEQAGAEIAPTWQRLLLGVFALVGLIGFASSLAEIFQGAYTNSLYDYFRLLAAFVGCLLFLFIAMKGRLPNFFVNAPKREP